MQIKSKPEYWKQKIMEYRRSLLSVNKWCEISGESNHKLRYWVDKFKMDGVTFDDLNLKSNETEILRNSNSKMQWLSVTPPYIEEASSSQMTSDSINIWVGSFRVSVQLGFDKETLVAVFEVLKRC